MISQVVMPSLGASGGDVVILEWLAQPLDAVKKGQPLFVVETDKATVEVEAFRDGYLRQIIAAAGASVAIGDVVGTLSDTPDEALLPAPPATLPSPETVTVSPALSQSASTARRIFITPVARRIAEEHGMNIQTVQGSGRDGIILKRDVLAILDIHPAGDERRIPLSSQRRAIASRTVLSAGTIPHFYAMQSLSMHAAQQFLEQAAALARQNDWRPPGLNVLILRAVALSLRQHPILNASLRDDVITLHEAISVGMVVGVDGGMLIPVIHHADQKNIYTLAADTQRLKERAAVGTLSGKDLSGGTFTVSNLGMYGLDSFTAIINPPEVGILAVGALREGVMTVTLSADHRVVDGVQAAEFMATLRKFLENPLSLVLEGPDPL